MKVLHLYCHRLVVVYQGGLLLLANPDLLNQVLGGNSFVLRVLAHGQAPVRLDQLALSVHDNCLELVTLTDQLLAISTDLLLQL